MTISTDSKAPVPVAPPSGELHARLEVARLERARVAKARSKLEAERSLAEQVEAEERALRNEQAISDAEAEHGAVGKVIGVVETSSGVVIVKRPHPALFRRFQDTAKQTVLECEKLVKPSLVYPDAVTFDAWADLEPAITLRAANVVVTLAGFRTEEVSGK